MKYFFLVSLGFIFSGLLDPIQYIFPDYAADYARYTAESAYCAQQTYNEISDGFFPTTLGCQPTFFRLKLAGFMALSGIIPSFLYLLFTPLIQTKSGNLWNKRKPILSVVTILVPLMTLLSPAVNMLDAFELSSSEQMETFERPIIFSVAAYASLNLLYLLGVFFRHRFYVLGPKD